MALPPAPDSPGAATSAGLDLAVLDLAVLCPEAVPGVRILPVVHERLEMAAVVRAALAELQPAAVAVELPTTLEAAVARAVARLPQVSLVLSEEPGEETLLWLVAPGDPLVEALRWARENGRPALSIDPDVRYLERHLDPVPDPYALLELGPERYLDLLRQAAGAGPASQEDELREAGMAHHLQQARAALDAAGDRRPLVALVGAAHALRLARRLASPAVPVLARQKRQAVEVRNLHPESLTALMHDPPLAHAAWELLRDGRALPAAGLADTITRRVSVVRHGLRLILGDKDDELSRRRHALPAFAAAAAGRALAGAVRAVDRRALAGAVWRVAAASYHEQTQEGIEPWQRRLFFDFASRYARVKGLLAPYLYEWVVAARGVADDNLAWEVFDAARTYPWQREAAEIETASVDGEELDLGTRKVRFRRRFFRVKQRPVRLPVRERPQTDDPEDWLRGFDDSGICSYPKEDLVIEDYAAFLRKKAVALLAAENHRSEPFVASMLDGIDLRETLRNLPRGEIWVQEHGRAPGQAGAVIVIFDPDPGGDAFPYCTTWLGEHDEESDMAFYSTDPFEQVVGPGIARATYGGFVMTSPPRRLAEVWSDPDYGFAATKPEVLLLAGIDYSEEKLVVHVAASPPAERFKRYAAAQGKRLVHIPLASLSPVTLKRIRVVHVLAGRDQRAIASRYIW